MAAHCRQPLAAGSTRLRVRPGGGKWLQSQGMSGLRTSLPGFILLASALASATTMLAMDVDALVSESDVIAVVRVESVETVRAGGRLTRHVHLTVEEALSGATAGMALVVLVPGGVAGDWGQRVVGAPEPQPGDKALVFLHRAGGGFHRAVGLAQGWLTITEDPNDPTRALVTRSIDARLVVKDPSTGELKDAPPPPATEPLLPLLDRVRRSVESR